tara:strand:+ start:25 stop:756 length:732 start_codon:yes stop_codon:yes gene_type:complete
MLDGALNNAEDFLSDAYAQRRNFYTNWGSVSRNYDAYSDQVLADEMFLDRFVSVGQVRHIFEHLTSSRLDYRCSQADLNEYADRFWKKLYRKIDRAEIDAHLHVFEPLEENARVKVGDLLAVLEEAALPDGHTTNIQATEMEARLLRQSFDRANPLSVFQEYMDTHMPLVTPSVDHEICRVQTHRLLNLHRPMLLAIGFSMEYYDATHEIDHHDIPTLRETSFERRIREQKGPPKQIYRGYEV